MKEERQPPKHLRRLWLISTLVACGILALIWRLIDLSIINRHFLQTQYAERTIREIVLPSYRGMIKDRNGEPLAISTPVYAAWVDPKTLLMTQIQLSELAKLLSLSSEAIATHIQKEKNRQFTYLKRDLSPDLAQKIKQLKIKGLYLQQQYRRFYPDGEATAQVIGITNIDDHGQEGLELAYNQWLEGSVGLQKVIKDRYGNIVSDLGIIRQPLSGHDLTLSLDNRLQYIAYNALVEGVQKFGAQSGSVVILDVHTGEILAMANAPSYNPNARSGTANGSYRNRAVTDLFEPGSTIKPLAMTAALTTGKFTPNSLINTSPGYWYVEGKRIDDDNHNNGIITPTTILQVSSNVGVSKIILSIPSTLFLNLLHDLGFTQSTNTSFPGEAPGTIVNSAMHSAFVLATVSFGYGINVNLLQLAHAYATLANHGIKVPLSFLKVNTAPPQTPIIEARIAQEILVMLESVLKKGGTATAARVPGYRVTGKTGTTRILGPHGYERDHHNSIFVGIAPASNPQLVIAVMLHDPSKKSYYGGFVAGPVFSQITGETLQILNVPPDDINP